MIGNSAFTLERDFTLHWSLFADHSLFSVSPSEIQQL